MDNIPTRGPSDLGAPLSNTRTPLTNEFSSVNLERIKDRIIELATDLGLGDGSTADSVWEWITNAATNVVGALASNVLAIDFNDVDLTGIGVLHPASLSVDNDASVGGNLSVGGMIDSLTAKPVVRLATTANGTLATAFANGQTMDGKTLVTNDRILLKNQSSAAENGIYVVNASGAPSRTYDCNAAGDVAHGLVVFVVAGDTNGGHMFVCTAVAPTPGSTGLAFYDHGPFNLTSLAALLATGTVAVTGDVSIVATGNAHLGGFADNASVSVGAAIGDVVIRTGDGLVAEFSDAAYFNGANLKEVNDPGAEDDVAIFRTTKTVSPPKKTAAYTLLATDSALIQVDDTAGRVDLTLPNPNTARHYTIQKVAGTTGGIRLIRHGSEKIMTVAASYDLPGATTAFSSSAPQAWFVYTDGTDWFVC